MKGKTGPWWWVCLGVFAWALAFCGPVFASTQPGADRIQLVEVHSQISGGKVHPILEERVSRAVAQVAQKALVGRPVKEVAQYHLDYAKSLAEVYNSSITGFKLESLEIVPGKVSLVQAVLRPIGDEVRVVNAKWAIDKSLPDWVAVTVGDTLEQGIERVKQVYQGVPLESISWAGPALLAEAIKILPTVPGFTFELSVTPAREMQLKIKVIPEVPLIYEVEVSTSSLTLPPVVLRQLTPQIRTALGELKDLPVAFAHHELSELERRLNGHLAQSAPLQQARLRYQVRLTVGSLTKAHVMVESAIYKMVWEGAVNFGSEVRPKLRLEAGRYLTPATRVLVDVGIPVTSLRFEPGVGVGVHAFGGDLVFVYSLTNQKPQLRYEYQLDETQRVRLGRDWHSGDWELAYGIKHTSYLTTEVVGNNSGIWFRLVGSL